MIYCIATHCPFLFSLHLGVWMVQSDIRAHTKVLNFLLLLKLIDKDSQENKSNGTYKFWLGQEISELFCKIIDIKEKFWHCICRSTLIDKKSQETVHAK